MNLSDVNIFLKEIGINNDKEFPASYFNLLDAFSRLMGESILILDYYNRGFVYVSSNPLFLCGYKPEDIQEMGYAFYKKVVVEDDLKMLMEIDSKGYELFHHLPLEDRRNSMISFNYRLIHPENKVIMVNQKKTPLLLTEQGDVRYALCVVSLSSFNNPGNVAIKVDNNILENYTYSLERKKWNKNVSVKITKREKEILQLAAQGHSNEEIANILFVNVGTIKFHKTNIFSKLNVKNITEAIIYARNNKLL